MKRISKYKVYMAAVCLLTILLNLLGCIERFCAFYRENIYGYIASALGFLMSFIPFPLGEVLMYVGAMIVISCLAVTISFLFLCKNARYRAFVVRYFKGILAVVCAVLLVYTVNWVLPFRAPRMDVKPAVDRKYSVEEMQLLRNYAVEKANEMALSIARDGEGRIILSENLHQDISDAMNNISSEFTLLKGYYPREKASLCSSFLEWMNIGGYTYPYTMEVSYNKYIDYLYRPILLSHEQCHHKGYYQEDEATFLSIIACVNSDSKYLQYSGFVELYYYIERDYARSMLNVYEDAYAYELMAAQPKLNEQVKADSADSLKQSEELYRKEVSIKFEEIFKKYAEEASEAGWKAQGEIIGDATYGGCVKYLLEYYEGVLY